MLGTFESISNKQANQLTVRASALARHEPQSNMRICVLPVRQCRLIDARLALDECAEARLSSPSDAPA